MAFRRSSPRLATPQSVQSNPEAKRNFDQRPESIVAAPETHAFSRDWPTDETALMREVLRCHGLPEELVERLVTLAVAPPHTVRSVDRLAVALASHFHFLPLEDALATPILLYGPAGVGVSTLAAKLAAKFDEREILVISTDGRGAAERAQLEEYLDVLGLPLAVAQDEASLRSIVAGAAGRKVIVDMACSNPTDRAGADRVRKFVAAAGAQGMLVLAADTEPAAVAPIAAAASNIGTRRMIVTRFDAERQIGAALVAAEIGKLAFVAASVTPHFAFGLRVLTPENLARRLMAAALRAERWRVAPL